MSHFIPTDPTPLREVLRGLRHGMWRSRRLLHEALAIRTLPGPVSLLTQPVLDGLDLLARDVDAVGTRLARTVLGGPAARVPAFEALLSAGEAQAAEALYAALRGALRRMGGEGAFVSEAAARRAVAATTASAGSPADRAAHLVLALVAERTVRDVIGSPTLRLPAERVAPVAVAAAALWLLAEHGGDDADAALDAAADLAVAMADEVVGAVSARDRERLGWILAEFAAHV